MEIAIISFTRNGFALSGKITEILKAQEHCVECYVKSKYLKNEDAIFVEGALPAWAGAMFASKDAIIFIGASGIAVRAIASHVQDKRYDPAVLILDEQGVFCIPLLAGHIGGANELAVLVSEQLGAQAVITTATDVNQRFAIDVFAKKNELFISDMTLAKEVSAKLLHGEPVGFYSELPVRGELPSGFIEEMNVIDATGRVEIAGEVQAAEISIPDELQILSKKEMPIVEEAMNRIGSSEFGVYIGIYHNKTPFNKTLFLIPRQVALGVGCRKGTSKQLIKELVEESCQTQGIFPEAISRICSIDLKKEEPGIIDYSKEKELDFITYTAEELKTMSGNYTTSDFVRSVTGVDNVCERSARSGSRMGELIQNKTGKNGVTVALAREDRSVDFE